MPQIFVEFEPMEEHQKLLSTRPGTVRKSSFWCVPEDSGDRYTRFSSAAGCVPTHNTPTNYTTHLALSLHMPHGKQINAGTEFHPSNSPDVHRMQSIAYLHESKHIVFTLAAPLEQHTHPKPELQKGDVISVYSFCVDHVSENAGTVTNSYVICDGDNESNGLSEIIMDGETTTEARQQLIDYFCAQSIDRHYVIQKACSTTDMAGNSLVVVHVDGTMHQSIPTTELPEMSAYFKVDPNKSFILNESMQYTLSLEFDMVVRRLRQHTVAVCGNV